MNTPTADAAGVLRRNSRSFAIAAMFLPPRVRGKIHNLYAWCRAVDDAVDQAQTHQAAEKALAQLVADLHSLRDSCSCHTSDCDAERQNAPHQSMQHAASQWIAPLILNQEIDVRHALELIEGMQLDLRMDRGELTIDSNAALLNYCYHAAGTVGLMMTQLMGVTKSEAGPPAIALGVAMQLTNIARDVREDADRNRCYLPGIGPINEAKSDAVQTSVRRVLQLAEQRYRVAAAGLHFLPRDCRRAIRVALAAYREIGREVARRDYQVLSGRTVVPKLRLLSVVLQATITGDVSMSHETTDREFSSGARPAEAASLKATGISSIDQCKHAVWLGLSLTAFMATALFVMVYFNPKSEAYSTLPLFYALASLVFAIVANRLAARSEAQHRAH